MSTQLRLVDPPPEEPPAAERSVRRAKASRTRSARPTRARIVRSSHGRRTHWAADWRLDATTRETGRAGIAAARAALARAQGDGSDNLSQAS